MFFILRKIDCRQGTFFVKTIATELKITNSKIPIETSATPSKALNTSLFNKALMCSFSAITFLSSDERFIIPETEVITISTLEGGNILLC